MLETRHDGAHPLAARLSILRNPQFAGAIAAVIGVSAAVWTFFAYTGNSSRMLTLGISDPDELRSYLGVDPDSIVEIDDSQFVPIQSRGDVDEVMREFEIALIGRAASTPVLRDAGVDAWRDLARASALAMAPFLTQDLDHLNENILALGGVAPDSEEALKRLQSLWDVVTNTMQFTEAAPARAEIVDGRIESRNDAVRIGDSREGQRLAIRMGMRITGGGGYSTTNTRFPDVALWDASDRTMEAYEVVLPVRLKIIKPGRIRFATIGVVMAREPAGGRWQPALLALLVDQEGDKMEFRSEKELANYVNNNQVGNLHMQ